MTALTWVDHWVALLDLETHVADAEEDGCARTDGWLGFASMPAGYALMLDADGMYFFWIRHDGSESCIHWNKWAVYRGAKHDAAMTVPSP